MSVYLKSRGEFFNRVFQVSHKMREMMAEAIHESRKCPLKFLSEIICSFCLTQPRAQTSHSLSSSSRESSQTFSSYHLVECGMVKEFNLSSSRVDGRRCIKTFLLFHNKFTSFIGIALSWCRWVHDISHPCHHVVLLLLCVRERRVRWGSQVKSLGTGSLHPATGYIKIVYSLNYRLVCESEREVRMHVVWILDWNLIYITIVSLNEFIILFQLYSEHRRLFFPSPIA